MEKIAAVGADGLRYDAVKHVPESWWRDYGNPWAEELGLFRIGEVYNSSVSYVQGYVDTGMTAFDYPLYYTLTDVFQYGGDLRKLSGAGLKAQDPLNAVTFVQNHDVDGPDNWYLAHAYVLTSEGYPMLYEVSLDDDAINNLVWIKNNLAGGATYDRYTSQDVYLYERYNNLLVGLNQSDSWTTKRVYTSWANTTLNDYTGSIGDVTTDGSGYVDVSVPPMGWVCLAPY
jgi:alpha-amylase